MADYVLMRKSRNMLSSALYFLFNVCLGVGSIWLTALTGSWILGVALVALSKWRIFAVRPRFWLLNLKSGLVDIIVGTSLVLIAYAAGTEWQVVHTLLALAYVVWLVAIKPRSSEMAMEAQALIATFLGMTAAVLLAASAGATWIALAGGLIGYAGARHVLVQSDDNNFVLLTLVSALLLAEIAWLSYSWLIVYTLADTGLIVPQLAIIATIVEFLFYRVCRSLLNNDGKLRWRELSTPMMFSILIILVIIVWFSQPSL